MRPPLARASAGESRALRAPVTSRVGTPIARSSSSVRTAYLALSLTDPALAIAPLVKNSSAVTGVLAAQLRAAQAAGDAPAHLNPDMEALSLMAMSAGLATSVLAGQSSAGHAQAVIDYHLDRLFPAPADAADR
jgi:hypothetical protein